MVIIKTTKGNYTVSTPQYTEEVTYAEIVEQWKNKNNRGFSVKLDSNFHLEENKIIINDEVLDIIRK